MAKLLISEYAFTTHSSSSINRPVRQMPTVLKSYLMSSYYSDNTSVKIYRTKKLNNGSRVTGSAI